MNEATTAVDGNIEDDDNVNEMSFINLQKSLSLACTQFFQNSTNHSHSPHTHHIWYYLLINLITLTNTSGIPADIFSHIFFLKFTCDATGENKCEQVFDSD